MPVPALGVGFRLAALAAALAAWALVAVGGVVRVTESGLGCPDWPLCEGRPVPHGSKEPIIEYSHRAVASVVAALVVLVAVWAWRRYRARLDVLLPAAVAAALVPFQALLGAVVVWLELPSWIVGVHFMVGLVFLAAVVATAGAAWRRPGRAASHGFVRLAWWSAAAGLLLVSLGAAVVSAHADEACGRDWPDCNGAFAAGGADAWLQVSHRTVAYVVAALSLWLAVSAWRGPGPRVAGLLPLVAVLAQIGIGVAMVVAGEESAAHEPLEILHVAGAGAVWALLVGLATLVGPPSAPQRAGRVVPVRAR